MSALCAMPSRPIIFDGGQLKAELDPEQRFQIDSVMGMATELFVHLALLAQLLYDVIHESFSAASSHVEHLYLNISEWHPDSSAFRPSMDPDSPSDHFISLAETYRSTGLIVLCQIGLALNPRPHGDDRIDIHVKQTFKQMKRIPKSSGVNVGLLWPLLVAGCEALDDADRAFTIDRLSFFSDCYQFSQALKAKEVIREVWRRRLQASSRVSDSSIKGNSHWCAVLKHYGWKLLLA